MNNSIDKVREDFPTLSTKVNAKPLIYFDNGATSQKPSVVIDAVSNYYRFSNSNVHRGVHYLSQKATEQYEQSRDLLKDFLGAETREQIVFTKGTTDAINLVANSWAEKHIQKGDEILITTMEHHSNIVPWQMICEKKQAVLVVADVNQVGEIVMDDFKAKVGGKTKLISVSHVSNTLGTVNPVNQIIEFAKKRNIPVFVDAAQSIPHMPVDVKDLDCDFLAFSGHKLFGPTGIGVLYAKMKWLNEMSPYQGGGDMIKEVTFKKTTYNEPPLKFEAGTPNIAGAIGLAAAVKYVNKLGFPFIEQQESRLLQYATKELLKIDGLRLIGSSENKAAVISFLIGDIHPFDVGTLLDQLGIAIRTGHHCTQPLMDHYKIPGTARATFSFYNTIEEIDEFVNALKKAKKMLS
ncbi:MAG: cysteine desulfurase [Bacteroidota bacterium]|nr:cysteine desulfurase [Bacteroidota bacterium]MEC8968076.1 cysteine desulfurase [Bacteroidota bacterium]